MAVDRDADRPVYKQLADLMRTQIERGELAPGQRIPAESDYVQRYGISRDSVRRAIAVLRSEGLIMPGLRGPHVRGRVVLTVVRVSDGKISTRIPTEPERRELGVSEGIPILVIERAGQDAEIHPGDRTVVEVDKG